MSTAVARPSAGMTRQQRRLLLSCFFGTTIEWYDFLIYGFLAPLVFDKLFFPQLSPTIGTIAVLSVFAVGFAARPLGGLVFGHFGDRWGRKPIMVLTLSLMGVATTLIGLMPTYETLGVGAPILLVTLRFLQGFALGGESSGGPVLAMESAPLEKRGFYAALVQSGAAAGTVLGALVAALVAQLPADILLAWAWRLPFLLSVVIVGIGLYIRNKVEESAAFQTARTAPKRMPLVTVLQTAKGPALIVFCCAIAESSTFYFTAVFGLTYGVQTLHLGRGALLTGVIIGNAVGVFANPLFGALSDKVGRRPVLGAAFVLAALYVLFMFFPLLRTADPVLVVLAMAIPGAILQPMSLSVDGSFYAELFRDVRVRLSGVSLGRQFGTIAGGGLMPAVSAAILAATAGSLPAVIAYFTATCVIAVIAVVVAPESRGT